MINKSTNELVSLLDKEIKENIHLGKVGIEKETFRVNKKKISQSSHPNQFGSALCNKFITTDFSESQLELITPPSSNKLSILEFLNDLQHLLVSDHKDEIFWPFSIPPSFNSDDDIPIANYGSSNFGKFKHLYRLGLSNRYGRAMQAISGIHFNYSLPEVFWKFQKNNKELKLNEKELRSKAYFRMIRNCFRMNWLVLYLFGASPILTKNYIADDSESFIRIDEDTYFMKYATSLRMSDYGYQNSNRSKINVSLDSLNSYTSDLRRATTTKSEDFIDFPKDGFQINPNILQIEDEYYAVARAKSSIPKIQRSTNKLLSGGVDFLELRSIDLNPFSPIGIDTETLFFLEVFLIYCYLEDEKLIDQDELNDITNNDLLVSKYGRDPKLELKKNGKKIKANEWGNFILDEMEAIAELMSDHNDQYKKMIKSIKEKINDPSQTLSGILIENIVSKSINFNDYGHLIGESNKSYYIGLSKPENNNWEIIKKEIKRSIFQQQQLEDEDKKSKKSLHDFIFSHNQIDN